MQRITPFLWYDNRAEEAATQYVSIFPNSSIQNVTRYAEGNHGQAGSVMTVVFKLDGQEFIALNGGPIFSFTPAISFSVDCTTQAEVDELWERLSEGGSTSQCGWLTDRFGISWQVVPRVLGELIGDPDPARAARVTKAMLGMTKLDIEELRRAHKG